MNSPTSLYYCVTASSWFTSTTMTSPQKNCQEQAHRPAFTQYKTQRFTLYSSVEPTTTFNYSIPKMFSRISNMFVFFTVMTVYALLAAATPWGEPVTSTTAKPPVTTTVTVTAPGSTVTSVDQCNTGPIQCCNSVQKASAPSAALLLGLLGIVLQDVTALVGITCSPLSVIGVGGNSCSAQPVCCQNNSFHGIIALGCVPININL
ncbi:hypothetical protein HGRIS_002347 [Hohenbuehelia grisea]|uniref:Hydrophobin n=1 Tax=Hohenbuehelia grisea TaxID=104357 RepID=A0ABR3JLC0_9AGAR